MIKGIVAIVGRPNVGKSSLFNRLVGKRTAIVDDTPGVTRDRLMATVYSNIEHTKGYSLIDTGGFETLDFGFQPFKGNLVWEQTCLAITQADVVVMLVDGKSGLHHHDQEIMRFLTIKEKPTILVVNKIDNPQDINLMWEFSSLTDKELLSVSAKSRYGLKLLREAIDQELNTHKTKTHPSYLDATNIALIGRPNAGKSSLLNRLVDEPRALVSDIPGTTRDSLDVVIRYDSKHYRIIDTAGIRRRTKISQYLENASVVMSLMAIERADVVVLVIDGTLGVSDQDLRLLNLALSRHKPLLLAVNKWDLIPNKTSNTKQQYLLNLKKFYLREHDYVPIHFMSCVINHRIHTIFAKICDLVKQRKYRIPTAHLNSIMEKIIQKTPPRVVKQHGKRSKVYYVTQIETCPPKIVLKCNYQSAVQESYQRFLKRSIRQQLAFKEIPFKLEFQAKK